MLLFPSVKVLMMIKEVLVILKQIHSHITSDYQVSPVCRNRDLRKKQQPLLQCRSRLKTVRADPAFTRSVRENLFFSLLEQQSHSLAGYTHTGLNTSSGSEPKQESHWKMWVSLEQKWNQIKMFLAEPELPQSQQSRLMALTLKPFGPHWTMHFSIGCLTASCWLFLYFLIIFTSG